MLPFYEIFISLVTPIIEKKLNKNTIIKHQTKKNKYKKSSKFYNNETSRLSLQDIIKKEGYRKQVIKCTRNESA